MKSKISKAKRNNQKKTKLIKQGKIKSKKPKKIQQQNVPNKNIPAKLYSDEEESDDGEDLLDMVEVDDLNFLKQSIKNQSYGVLKKIRLLDGKRKNVEDDGVEQKYEDEHLLNNNRSRKKLKMMLPLKTKDGIVEQTVEVDDTSDIEDVHKEPQVEQDENKDSDLESYEDADELDKTKVLTTVDLLALRAKAIKSVQEKVGVICSGLLEDPEGKITNIKLLFNLFDNTKPEVYLFTKKLIATSLLEVFKDLLPSYAIREQQTNSSDVKLKKDTLKLIKFEDRLLHAYKLYLQKLEKMVGVLITKKGNTQKRTVQELKMGEVGVYCLCQLLITHSYFNFSKNIVQLLVPLLNHRLPNIRQLIGHTIAEIFKTDKKGEITLIIMQRINYLVKTKAAAVLHVNVLETLLSLKLKNINLDQVKEHNYNKKKLISHKHRVLQLSKKERKRRKQLDELNKELLETQAEENKSAKQKLLTEVTKLLFTIYFRILKQYPTSKLLSVTLEGVAKFAHLINLDFYMDLVNVINNLLDEHSLGYRQQLHCVLTVITILSGQGDVLNIDPLRFYTHLYKNLLEFHAGRTHKDYGILIQTLEMVLIKRRKKMSLSRLAAYAKRLATLALIALHNSSLSCLAFIKTLLQLSKPIDILLDCDSSIGIGNYLPMSDDPEYANATSSALWELTLLTHHYHPTVRKMAQYIGAGVPSMGDNSLQPELKKLNAIELFSEFDFVETMAFKPAVAPPLKKCTPTSKSIANHNFINDNFHNYCKQIYQLKIPMHYFYIDGEK